MTQRLAELLAIPEDAPVLQEALTHPSFANERPEAQHYQRLEFLGDAVLQLCVSELLFTRYPQASEGALTRMRAQLVSGEALASWARRQHLAGALRLGKGAETSGLGDNTAVLADTVEALVAAAYVTGGLEAARRACRAIVEEALAAWIDPVQLDPKSALQEALQRDGRGSPTYELLTRSGPDHEPWFEVRVVAAGRELGRGKGKSKRAAERQAADAALGGLGIGTAETPADAPADSPEPGVSPP